MEQPSSSSPLRSLLRPPSPATASSAASITSFPPFSISSSSNPSPPNLKPAHFTSAVSASSTSSPSTSTPAGVVVVGFIGSRTSMDVTHLVNCILDANVFGSGNLAKDLLNSSIPDAGDRVQEDWWRRRRISYYYEPEKGMVFLDYSRSSPTTLLHLSSAKQDGRDDEGTSVLEECEANDLRAMLLLFSVCHVVVFVHEGLRFDIQVLKKFRVLQAAKHAFSPFVRSKITPFFPTKSSSISQSNSLRASSTSPSNRRGGSSSRHSSSISVMSGTSSHPSMLPGQCIPVVLFVFEYDFSTGSSSATNADDITDDSSRQNLTLKGSGSVVMLARPPSKTEGSFRKRLHSSLETQIRFLIKKCRVLIGTDHSHFGSRGIGNVNSLPLFSLDTSRVVALLDSSINQRGEPLNFVTSFIEEAISSKTKIDLPMLENHCQKLINEDIQSIKDFIFRQADMLRGRGGLPSNANSVSTAGVGMVAAAAAAAAASAASAAAGKSVNAPELPSLENWLTSTNQILGALFSVDRHFITLGNIKRLPVKKTATEMRDLHALEDAVSCLESSKNLNMKFSVCWCEKALPSAKEVYLEGLPAFYPTSMHKAQLENALLAFNSMVRGPAVKLFAKKLADDCTSIWEGGRQLCDAVSLTGKPCMHPRHDANYASASQKNIIKQHSSGYVFLHACACGRLRRLRDDPFDFESANITFNLFKNCENLLPALFLPKVSNGGALPHTSWSLLRVGGAGYYEPSKGLLQMGFCSTQKFLMKWTILIEKQKEANGSPIGVSRKGSVVTLSSGPKAVSGMGETQRSTDAKIHGENHPVAPENHKKVPELVSYNSTSISFGKGLPSFSMKKPFAEVVAGTATADSIISAQLRKQRKDGADKGATSTVAPNQHYVSKNATDYQQASPRAEHVSPPLESPIIPETNHQTNDNPYLQIGTNIVPVNMSGIGDVRTAGSLKQATMYVGFEHECPYGHRFLLSPEHLKDLDSSYSVTHKPQSSTEDFEGKYAESKVKGPGKIDRYSSRKVAAVTTMRNDKFDVPAADVSLGHEGFTFFSKSDFEKLPSSHGPALLSESVDQIEGRLSHVKLDDDSSAFSLLSRNLPLYMNCPHCGKSPEQTEKKTKFASMISQLQRIFLVTPPFPTLLATCPIIQFEESCLPQSTPDREQQSHFGLGCRIILPPESFLTLRFPFIYGVRNGDGNLQPLHHLEHKPENTAWLVKGTALQLVSVGHDEPTKELQMQ